MPPAGARNDVLLWSVVGEAPLAALWRILRVRSLCLVVSAEPAIGPACSIAGGLRVQKLVLIDRRGGLKRKGSDRPLSYLDGADLDALLGGGEEALAGLRQRRALLDHVDEVLDRGVSSVNLCGPSGLARELFTYEGSGTFFSRDDHCHVGPLSIDDFDEVERLITRGQREGLLKPRTADEIAEILLGGFGVWLGAGHLAGVAGLRTWETPDERAGEIIGLYTFTRFQGEGIGARLVARVLEEAAARGLVHVFAVTTSERAARFFRREGFVPVSQDEVPAAKWEGYDPARRTRARVFRRTLRRRGRSSAAGAMPARRRRSGSGGA